MLGCELTRFSFLPDTGCNTRLLNARQNLLLTPQNCLLFKASLAVYTSLRKLCYWFISGLLVTVILAAVRLRAYLSSISTVLQNRFHSNDKYQCYQHNLMILLTDSWVLNYKKTFFDQQVSRHTGNYICLVTQHKAGKGTVTFQNKLKRFLQKYGNQQSCILLKTTPAKSVLKLFNRVITHIRGIRPSAEVFKSRF